MYARFLHGLFLLKVKTDGIYTISFACSSRPIVEDVAQMRAATGTRNFRSFHSQRPIAMLLNGSR